MSPIPAESKSSASRRTVCDHCRRRRIRCDGQYPCNQCNSASLACKRDHVPRRRGPKRGSGRVINELRALDCGEQPPLYKTKSNGSTTPSQSSGGPPSIDQWMSESKPESRAASTSPTTQHQRWHPIMSDTSLPFTEEPQSIFTSDQYRPNSVSYFHLIPICLELFIEHIYPIMPLVHIPTLRASLNRPLEMFEKNLTYALCAITSTHMSGKSIIAPGPPSWEAAGRFFLDECLSIRQNYDFVEDKSLSAVISSYFVSTAFFELNQNRKSWYYLREALTMGQDLGFHDEKTYAGLLPAEALCRRRTFWILYVTERSFAILRHKPLTLQKTPDLPNTLHEYEAPEIHSGFMQVVSSYHLLDSSFVDSWNESADAPASTVTYTALQRQLNLTPTSNLSLTDIQKADILVTQQWLRLIVWQSSMRQGLLSSHAEDESMTFHYPLKIANALLEVLRSLPSPSIEVHGMGIFEKIFEVGNTMLDVMQMYGSTSNVQPDTYGISQDPFQLFVKTLSQTPNSQRQYASLLLAKAAEKPEVLRYVQIPQPGLLPPMDFGLDSQLVVGDGALMPPLQARQWRGSIVGEIAEDGTYKPEEGMGNEWVDQSSWVGGGGDDAMGRVEGGWTGKVEIFVD